MASQQHQQFPNQSALTLQHHHRSTQIAALRPFPSTSSNDNPSISSSQHSRSLLHQTRKSLSLVQPTTNSPDVSRDNSPIRQDCRTSAHIATQPSATAIQRALSASSIPQLTNNNGQVSDAISKRTQVRKGATALRSETTLHWPVSPRLKSPPPNTSSRRSRSYLLRKNNIDSNIAGDNGIMDTSTPPLNPINQVPNSNEDDSLRNSESQLQIAIKSASRTSNPKGMLETVQENSADSLDPGIAAPGPAAELRSNETKILGKRSAHDLDRPTESGSESAGNKSDHKRGRRESSGLQNTPGIPSSKPMSKSNYGTLTSAKARQAEGKHGMTVETETVPSIPQSALNPGDRRNDNGGSVRLKPSNETIRPKKDRRKFSSKPRSITQGTASTKADIFEARVASAVDAHSSDSDNTFVYESNPPEPQRTRRHHSRTPSVTSAHSVADQRSTIRTLTDADERKVAGKRSMKFSTHHDLDPADGKSATLRAHRPRRMRTDREESQQSMLDPDSLFTHTSKLRNSASRPVSPRSPQMLQSYHPPALLANKSEQIFDLDGAVADDERTPLIASSARSLRGTRPRRTNDPDTSLLRNYYDDQQASKRWFGLARGFCLGMSVLVAAILLAVAMLMVWNRPLYDVKIRQIENVLATEQEIILDLCVAAVNPNMLSISVSDMDLNVFAKSKHVGKSVDSVIISEFGSSLPTKLLKTSGSRFGDSLSFKKIDYVSPRIARRDGVDHGTDPPNRGDLEPDSQTMLLGRVFKFDQALNFENTLFTRKRTYAMGELSLMKPGNKTETGGSARWERVLQYPFELIVRGTLKYKLPISMRSESVAVEGNIVVHPEEGSDASGNMRLEPAFTANPWQ